MAPAAWETAVQVEAVKAAARVAVMAVEIQVVMAAEIQVVMAAAMVGVIRQYHQKNRMMGSLMEWHLTPICDTTLPILTVSAVRELGERITAITL